MSDPILRLNTALEGRYRVLRELGEGGMATVYLADDLRHERKVALKVLKPDVASLIGADRFLSEIKTTANLQHPHILPLFDSGSAESHLFYAMPYVEGESLRERLVREHELPVEDAVRIATHVAEALDYAHRQGVVHRDIKPANILLQDGQPVVADFGIALALGAADSGRMTRTGAAMGTPQYMSPEQSTGDHQIGPPADIFALGTVLYEMLTGRQPFEAPTAQAALLKVLTDDPPPITGVRKSVPDNVASVVSKSLEKLPADRFPDAGEVARALADPTYSHRRGSLDPFHTHHARRSRMVTSALVAVAVVGAFAAGWVLRSGSREVTRLSLNLPPGISLSAFEGPRVTAAPDGRSFAYVGDDGTGGRRIWVRELDRLRATELPGTEGGSAPAFAADGRRIAFLKEEALMVAHLDGSPAVVLAEGVVGDYSGSLAWGRDDNVYLAQRGISRVAAGGGEWEMVIPRDSLDRWHFNPDVLPNGKGVLFSLGLNETRTLNVIAVGDLATGEVRTLTDGVAARYVRTGHIVVVRADGSLEVAPFDTDRMEMTGPSAPLGVTVGVRAWGATDVSISGSGTLLYTSGVPEPSRQIVWVDQDGFERPVDPAWTGPYESVALSPDGRRLAVGTGFGAEPQLWIKSLDRGPLTRLTLEGDLNRRPVWSEDGESITFISDRDGNRAVYRKRADGVGSAEVVLELPEHVDEAVWSPGEAWLAYRTGISGGEGRDLYAWQVGQEERKIPIAANPDFDEMTPALSPDGRWIAYRSMESGRTEVYVLSFPDTEQAKIQVSTDGGFDPRWSRDGSTLFYVGLTANGRPMMAAELRTSPELEVVRTRTLFPMSQYFIPTAVASYDVGPDDQTFLLIREDRRPAEGELIMVQNFAEELRRGSSGN